MSQHDLVVDNASGAVVRAELNQIFDAIVTLQSGSSAPGAPVANMFWYDTANSVLKQRDNGNTVWNTVGFVTSAGGKLLHNIAAATDITHGLAIDQLTADDAVMVFHSTGDVAHGVTTQLESTAYGAFKKVVGADGGLGVLGISDGTRGLQLQGIHTTDDTTKATNGIGAVVITGSLKSGTGTTTLGANANILAVRNVSTTRFILDGEGDSHQDVGTAWTNFDSENDVTLLTALSVGLSRFANDPVRENFAHFLEDHREALEKHGLVTFNEDGHHFINWSRTNMVVIGAVRQQAEKMARVEHFIRKIVSILPRFIRRRLELDSFAPTYALIPV